MNSELREFLRSRRARLTPEDVGIPALPGRRRVLGLRREEVAELAGVSVDYYVRLERGKRVNVSDSVLNALCRALQLDETERLHLYAIARSTRDSIPLEQQRVRRGLQLAVDAMVDVPALVVGHRTDILYANPLARALYKDFSALPVEDQNMTRFVFLDPAARELYGDWPTYARNGVAALRLYAGRHPHDPRLASLVSELSVRDADFRRWWAENDVYRHVHGTKHLHHPRVGDITIHYESMASQEDPDIAILVHTTEPGSRSEDRLRLLRELAEQELDATRRPRRS